MISQLKKFSARLSKNARLISWYGYFRNKKDLLFRGILFVILVSVGTIFFPRDKTPQYSEYQVGTIAPEEIISTDDFPINKSSQEYDREKEEARNNILAVFYRDFIAESDAGRNIVIFFNNLQQFKIFERDYRALQSEVGSSQTAPDTSLVNQSMTRLENS